MEIFDSYKAVLKEKPNYKNWKDNKNDIEAKRLSYIQKNGISEAQKQEDIKRAKAVLAAVDTMDEYSQSRAEDMEMVIQGVTQNVSGLLVLPGALIGGAFALFNPKAQKMGDKALMIFPAIGAAMGTLIGMPFLSQWGARKEIEASMDGRFEAMTKDLASVKQFAVLTDEQEQKVNETAKNIQIPPKEAKKANIARGSGFIKAALSFFKEEEQEMIDAKKEFKNNLKANEEKFDKVQLSEKQIEEAKKDKQLIQNIVEKVDIASQDYAENIELATGFLSAAGLGSGTGIGAGIKKILSHTKMSEVKQMAASFGIGGALVFAFSIAATKLQKQASRVARFKVKQDFLNNPDKLFYVDDEKVKNEDGTAFKQGEKKQNFFKFLIQAFKDNKEYNDYIKTQNIEKKQRAKALDSIELTPEQEKRARQLQQNTFKMFNKLDEKSQTYSEQTEALGEVVQAVGGSLAGLFMTTGIGDMVKSIENMADSALKESDAILCGIKASMPILKKAFFSIIPLTILNTIVTKEQKNASRVADMTAIREMDDFRNFADYSDTPTGAAAPASAPVQQSSTLSPMLAKMVKK